MDQRRWRGIRLGWAEREERSFSGIVICSVWPFCGLFFCKFSKQFTLTNNVDSHLKSYPQMTTDRNNLQNLFPLHYCYCYDQYRHTIAAITLTHMVLSYGQLPTNKPDSPCICRSYYSLVFCLSCWKSYLSVHKLGCAHYRSLLCGKYFFIATENLRGREPTICLLFGILLCELTKT